MCASYTHIMHKLDSIKSPPSEKKMASGPFQDKCNIWHNIYGIKQNIYTIKILLTSNDIHKSCCQLVFVQCKWATNHKVLQICCSLQPFWLIGVVVTFVDITYSCIQLGFLVTLVDLLGAGVGGSGGKGCSLSDRWSVGSGSVLPRVCWSLWLGTGTNQISFILIILKLPCTIKRRDVVLSPFA